jgi:hypothetical protein
MKSETVGGLGIALALALIVALGLAVYLIGGDRLFILGAALVGGMVCAGILAGLALLVRAFRKNDNPPVIERYHTDGTKTIIRETKILDGRAIEAPKLYQLPSQPSGSFYPELMRAAFTAGALGQRAGGETVDAEVRELTADEWSGDIST